MRIFGSTILETYYAFKPKHLGLFHKKEEEKKTDTKKEKIIAISRLIVSVFLIFLATFLLTFKSETSELGATIIGAIIGYWLK